MKKTDRRGLSGNGGFSLVELLVAVIILGIIVSPLLHTFVTGAVTASKSRKMGDATLAAQNISEAIEASDLNTDVILNAAPTIFGGTATRTANDVTSGKYEYDVSDISAGKSTFKAHIAIDSQHSVPNSVFNTINSQQISDYSEMDAIFAQPQGTIDDPDVIAFEKFKTEAAGDNYTGLTVSRSIKLSVAYAADSNGAADTSKIMATLSFNYVYNYTANVVNSAGATEHTKKSVTGQQTYSLFPQGFTVVNGKMPNIYLLYNPWYSTGNTPFTTTNNTGADPTMDIVKIENHNNISFSAFIVKQKAGTNLTEQETNYSATLILEQQAKTPMASVYSNMRENLTTKNNIATVSYKLQLVNGWAYYPLESVITGNLVSQNEKDRIYDVTITIKDASDKVVTTLNTTKLQ